LLKPSGYFADPFIAIEAALISSVPANTGMLLTVMRLTAKKSEITCRKIFIVELSAEVSLNGFIKTSKLIICHLERRERS